MGAYDTDFYDWAIKQAALLRAGRVQDIDLDNIAEEIESLGRSEKRELVNRLSVLIAHLFKWQLQPSHRGRGWILTIKEQRTKLQQHLRDNPSLRAKLPEAVEDAHGLGVLVAQRETGLAEGAFPRTCPWAIEDILNPEFFPE